MLFTYNSGQNNFYLDKDNHKLFYVPKKSEKQQLYEINKDETLFPSVIWNIICSYCETMFKSNLLNIDGDDDFTIDNNMLIFHNLNEIIIFNSYGPDDNYKFLLPVPLRFIRSYRVW